MSLDLISSIQYLKGVGQKRAEKYSKLGIKSIDDLLHHFPRNYIDLSNPFPIASAPFDRPAPIKGILISKSGEQRIRRGLSIFKLLITDETDNMEITIFNAKYLVDSLKLDNSYIFYGPVEGSFIKRKMTSPAIFPIQQNYDILPVYNQTAGIQSGLIRKNIIQALNEIPPLDDPIPEKYREKHSLEEINSSLGNIHFPSTLEMAAAARNRFIFEELLTLSCALHSIKSQREKSIVVPFERHSLEPFFNSLPYAPTGAQLRCINEAVTDMVSSTTMSRLIQGDVGSGKTLIAAACVYFAYKNNVQSTVMVPTEILAGQHFATFSSLLSGFGITTKLLTGSTKAAEKREFISGLQDGSVHLCIGTHALLSDNISFQKLGLVITDEQHRFGVAQRATLSKKSENVHVMIMSATPIPRTLSLIIYGDLSLSVLDEFPPGRQPVDTLLIDSPKLSRAMGFIRKHLDLGQQAYIVCPLVELGEIDTNLKPAVEYSAQLAEGEFRNYTVGLLHGKMKSKEKELVMQEFKSGKIQLLVSTTVVEVGVDIPNATIMLIENADRFGLSQLHQLRGRVGRGDNKSYCILVSDSGGEIAKKRLLAMKELNDGFKLAEYDLKLRGPGDFFGYRQHGLPALKIADLAENLDTLKDAQGCAEEILKTDPVLSKPEHKTLKANVKNMIAAVGKRPN